MTTILKTMTTLAVALVLVAPLAMGNTVDLDVEAPVDDSVTVPMDEHDDPLVCGAGDMDLWVDACGDEMYGDLGMHANIFIEGDHAIAFAGGELRAHQNLTFNDVALCLADIPEEGCGTINGVLGGWGLAGGGTNGTVLLDADPTAVQARITETCSTGSYVRVIAQNGTITCGAYTAGEGLLISNETFIVDMDVVQSRIKGACGAGEYIRMISADGEVTCDIDQDTIYGPGHGLGLKDTLFFVDTDEIQARVSDSCSPGSYVRAVGLDGNVDCSVDQDTTYDGSDFTLSGQTCGADDLVSGIDPLGALVCETFETDAWMLGGNSDTSLFDFIGTTDDNPLQFRVDDTPAFTISPGSDFVGSTEMVSPNLVGGYEFNRAGNDVAGATISGGGSMFRLQSVEASWGTIGGGSKNTVTGTHSTIGGGHGNEVSDDGSTIAGGLSNTVSNQGATVGGGSGNVADGFRSTVSGGQINSVVGTYATAGGGRENMASGRASTVPGGQGNTANGDYSFAVGRNAQADHDGAFIWGDSTDSDVASPGEDTFSVRAGGGIWLGTTNNPDIASGRFIDTSTGGYLSSGGAWTDSSDRGLKQDFEAIDPRNVLERAVDLPVTEWSYKDHPDVRHMGPVAQDFHAAFGLGVDDKSIAGLDSTGVALAAIQGLNEIVVEQDEQIQRQSHELEEKEQALQEQGDRIDDLEERLANMEGMLEELMVDSE